jgi:hypothetical protein
MVSSLKETGTTPLTELLSLPDALPISAALRTHPPGRRSGDAK